MREKELHAQRLEKEAMKALAKLEGGETPAPPQVEDSGDPSQIAFHSDLEKIKHDDPFWHPGASRVGTPESGTPDESATPTPQQGL